MLNLTLQTLINENNRLKAAIVVGENHTCQLEEKVRSLVASLEDAKKNTELLEDVGRSETRTPLIHNKTQVRRRFVFSRYIYI